MRCGVVWFVDIRLVVKFLGWGTQNEGGFDDNDDDDDELDQFLDLGAATPPQVTIEACLHRDIIFPN